MATTNLDNKTITIEYNAEVPQSVCKAASVLPVFIFADGLFTPFSLFMFRKFPHCLVIIYKLRIFALNNKQIIMKWIVI